jgi:two-component system, OmpR family, sensor histidine kinase MprB
MPLRKRVSLVAAAAVAVAIALAAMVCYVVVHHQLLGQIDSELTAQASHFEAGDYNAIDLGSLPANSASSGGPAPYEQVVSGSGQVITSRGNVLLPVDRATIAVAGRRTNNVVETVTVGGADFRMITMSAYASGSVPVAVQLARPLGPVESVLAKLRLVLVLLLFGGIALAAVLGRIAANRVLAPLAEVTQTAQLIGQTDDLSLRLGVHADDEVGQLATRFNEMLIRLAGSRDELDESVRAQRQLVADASHELRTPVTSLRTNIEVLLAGGELGEDDRRRLLDDVVEQSEELSALVSDLIELARGDLPHGSTEDVRLDRVVEESLARARRNAPQVHFEAQLQPVIVEGVGERLARVINNLLDNAARHSEPGGTVEVAVDTDGVRVRDHGSGIAPEDLPYVFDRFYRGANSRGQQGSGLGLAIVRQVTEQLGGTASAANAPEGGAVFTLRLPATAASPAAVDASEDLDGDSYGAGGLATRA